MQSTLTIRQEAVPIVKSSPRHDASHWSSADDSIERDWTASNSNIMTFEQFATRFGAGELGDDAAWFEWEFVLDAMRETERQLESWITKT